LQRSLLRLSPPAPSKSRAAGPLPDSDWGYAIESADSEVVRANWFGTTTLGQIVRSVTNPALTVAGRS